MRYILEKTVERLYEQDITKVLVNDTLEITNFSKVKDSNKLKLEFELRKTQVEVVTNYKLLDSNDNIIDERNIYVPIDGITIIKHEIEVISQ
ncbi:hypothetical protein PV797_07240 [Clostridiaceae bacterium M8S5]|nr:hypothetical protein PV797_07240 [Clostridiaceae bacterium M8S5]